LGSLQRNPCSPVKCRYPVMRQALAHHDGGSNGVQGHVRLGKLQSINLSLRPTFSVLTMKYAKTEAGLAALKDRTVKLTPRQRTALLMTDGRRTWPEVQSIAGCSSQDWQTLIDLELVVSLEAVALSQASVAELAGETTLGGVESINFDLEDVPGDPNAAHPAPAIHVQAQDLPAVDSAAAPTAPDAFEAAHAQINRLCSSLGLRGFHVGLALQSARNWDDLAQAAQRLEPLLDKAQLAQLRSAISKR
jgi:hypothetical protein